MEVGLVKLLHASAGLVLLVLGLLALTARKNRTSRHTRVGEVYFWLLIATLSSGMLVGLEHWPRVTVFEIVTPPTLLLGLLGYVMAKRRPKQWLRWHIFGQGGSYIGVVTAFAFQAFPTFLPPSPVLTTAYWLLPTLIGSVLIARTTAKWVRTPATILHQAAS